LDMDQFGGGSPECRLVEQALRPNRHSEPHGDTLV
jgi:hypothetical protein